MNYGATTYTPNYAAAYPAYSPQYAQPYTPQYPLAAYGGYGTGQLAPAAPIGPPTAPAAAPGITTAAWWQETGPLGVPKWALGTGAVALGLIGYGYYAGWFGRRTSGGTRTRRASARDVSGDVSGDARSRARRSGGRRSRAGTRRRRSTGRGRGRSGGTRTRYDFDF